MVRLLEAAQSMSSTTENEFYNHRRRAKNRARAIIYTRGKDKKAALYRDLKKVTILTLGYLEWAKMILTVTGSATLQLEAWHARVAHYLPLIKQVIDQTQRRVLQGESGLILDVVIEEGNPVDTDRLLPMLERHIKHYGCAPKQLAVDGGYASQDNLDNSKESGIKDVAFH